MFRFIRNWFDRRIISRSTISRSQWDRAFALLPLLHGIADGDRRKLEELVILFLHHKTFEGAHELEVSFEMKLLIALQACLPILQLDRAVYDGWVTVIVYPAGFAPRRVVRDEYGVEHHVQSHLSGEAWQHGPVILSWDETRDAGIIDGSNLVIHEFAHKLDMQNGAANGFPPLHRGMQVTAWTEVMSAAFEDLQRRCDHDMNFDIDCYAASSPAEFFAVMSEVFFERPGIIRQHYPDVYEQFLLYYRQSRLPISY